MHSKNFAERFYSVKVKQAQENDSPLSYQLVLAVLEDYQVNRHVLNVKDSKVHQLESMILSGLTGKQIDIPEWPIREAQLLQEYA